MAHDLYPKNATDLLNDLERYRTNRMTKAELTERWTGHQWPTQGLRAWALWCWKDAGL